MDPVKDAPLPFRAKFNWVACVMVMSSTSLLSVWALTVTSTVFGASGESGFDRFATLPALIYHLFVACAGTIVLLVVWIEPVPLHVHYTVMGEPQYKAVKTKFVHKGIWTTFTLWCNTLGTIYFWSAAACSAVALRTGSLPQAYLPMVKVLWEITFPMSFLVNLVVTFALLPGLRQQGKFEVLWYMHQLRPQCMHNGYVLVSAVEAALFLPPMALGDFPIIVIFGLAYSWFSYILFAMTGIFHYFFFDPRFKFAPCALVALLMLLTAIYCAGGFAMSAAAQHWVYRAAIVVAALATCSFRDAQAVAPSDASEELC